MLNLIHLVRDEVGYGYILTDAKVADVEKAIEKADSYNPKDVPAELIEMGFTAEHMPTHEVEFKRSG